VVAWFWGGEILILKKIIYPESQNFARYNTTTHIKTTTNQKTLHTIGGTQQNHILFFFG